MFKQVAGRRSSSEHARTVVAPAVAATEEAEPAELVIEAETVPEAAAAVVEA